MLKIYYCCAWARYVNLTSDDKEFIPQNIALVFEEFLKINSLVSVQGEYFFVWDMDCEWMKIFIDLGENSKLFNTNSFLLYKSEESIQGVFIAEIKLKELNGLSAKDIQKVIQEASFAFWNQCMCVIDKERSTVLRGTHDHFGA